ncbi:MAG TPA: GNAT family N-acetyltransferase [Microbacterium sp.]|nr:GNAT family N-acetyltransferase [Microbacterium sp.]
MTIRPATPGEADAISDLALRSKAHWGYSAEFLEMCRAELTYSPEQCTSPGMWVAAQGDELLGFYVIEAAVLETAGTGDEGELAALFVAPERIGEGIGGGLLRHALAQAAATGIRQLYLDADPGAEPFYRHHGARTVGETPSGSIPGRVLPRMTFDLGERASDERVPAR